MIKPNPKLKLGASTEQLADDERLPEQIAEIAAFAAAELLVARPALSEPEARRLGARVAGRLCREFGGSRYYWRKGDALDRAVRNAQIAAEHDGTVDGANGVRALARRYKMTDVHVWRIISRERQRYLERVRNGGGV